MAWVRFLAPMDWKPRPQVTIAFRAGDVKNVPRAAVEAAVSAGKAVRMRRVSKYSEPVDEKT